MEYINEEYQNAHAAFLMLSELSPLGSYDLLIGKQFAQNIGTETSWKIAIVKTEILNRL